MEEQEGISKIIVPEKSERTRRVHAFGVALMSVVLLSVAFILNPSREGVGTHRQLGLPECGWILAADVPCPTCGMTTAWSHTVRGEFPTAFMTQPLGLILAFITFFVAVGGFVTGIHFNPCFIVFDHLGYFFF